MQPLPFLPHVTYVTPDAGPPLTFADLLGEILARPGELALFGIGALLVLGALALDLWRRPLGRRRDAFVGRAQRYLGLTPWMLRLSLGLPLLGAGVLRYAFAPDVTIEGFPSAILSGLGFLLLVGLGSRLAAAAVIAVGAAVFVLQPHLIEVVEMPAVALGILLVGGGVPALDDLLAATASGRATSAADAPRPITDVPATGIPEPDLRDRGDLLGFVVRVGLGVSLLSAGLAEKLLDPGRAALAVERYRLTEVLPISEWTWIGGVGLVESAIGAALIVGFYTRFVAIAAFAVLTLTLFALPDDPVLAHVTLFGAASVLVVTGGGRFGLDALVARIHGARRPGHGSSAAVGGATDLQPGSTAPGSRPVPDGR